MDDRHPIPHRDGPNVHTHVSLLSSPIHDLFSHANAVVKSLSFFRTSLASLPWSTPLTIPPSAAPPNPPSSVPSSRKMQLIVRAPFIPYTYYLNVLVPFGESIASEGKGDYMLVRGRILDVQGNPVPDATIDTWETDANGFYDTQYVDRGRPDCRGRLKSDRHGRYQYRAVVPVSYPIPGDGPVGAMLEALHRHNNRPAHLHVMIEKKGYHKLVTALYPEGDRYLTSDTVFGVKKSLVVVRSWSIVDAFLCFTLFFP